MRRSFHKTTGDNQEWLTPRWIVEALGIFQLDPCAVHCGPWLLAENNYDIFADGLSLDWNGWRTFMNPPFDRYVVTEWYRKMAENNNGIALQIGKTETKWFKDYVKPIATSMLFMDKRFHFLYRDGSPAEANCGGSPVLVAYGEDNSDAIEDSGIDGLHVPIGRRIAVIVNMEGTWYDIVSMAIRGREEINFKELYAYIEQIAPDKKARNPWWKEQVRKQVYRYKSKSA